MRTLDALRQEATQTWQALEQETRPRVLVGAATCGRAAGALAVIEAVEKARRERGLEVLVTEVGCLGLCCMEPVVTVYKPGRPAILYGNVTPPVMNEILQRWLLGDDPCLDRAIATVNGDRLDGIPPFHEHPMLKAQSRLILRNCGVIDPTNFHHYLARGGYLGLENALRMPPEMVIEQVKRSGLRGRGGAGFPTWRKWQLCREVPGSPKYIICNADEGDPGAFMNRALLEGDPHSMLEGMLIAGYAIGASKGYIYIRAEYPLAVQRLRTAISQMREAGLLGEHILDSSFSFDIEIREGAGAFVCGEETALIASIEGRRGMPRPRPPFPAQSGLWGRPTVINNVETLAAVSHILRDGPDSYARLGTSNARGTKTFSLAGKVQRTGLIEVPLGITLRQIIFDIGGGIAEGRAFKAVQTGGPSGGCLPASHLDTPVDYESLTAAGSIMGSGGLVVMDDRNCAVDIAHYFLSFTQAESCGKCPPCRVGTQRMLWILESIQAGTATMEDLDLLESLAQTVKAGSLCGLGQTAPNPVLTTLRYFRSEYEAHVRDRRCPAGVCRALITYRITDECTGCTLCARLCPMGAISGQRKQKHVIDPNRCERCGACLDACSYRAIVVN
ncbi:MAG: NADH-quinone oxidoreductase subunit NuoF [Anaerolineae bacterium]|nr:NADH-quinone oxidoreductase subunit NuoF [Anaerolineae bacterium]MDW8099542.1 NADH-quinone oxidoreductase subunit NuoF [Anaerolineae bacterium]